MVGGIAGHDALELLFSLEEDDGGADGDLQVVGDVAFLEPGDFRVAMREAHVGVSRDEGVDRQGQQGLGLERDGRRQQDGQDRVLRAGRGQLARAAAPVGDGRASRWVKRQRDVFVVLTVLVAILVVFATRSGRGKRSAANPGLELSHGGESGRRHYLMGGWVEGCG